jgi:two-component system CheB/CheR fusion protein
MTKPSSGNVERDQAENAAQAEDWALKHGAAWLGLVRGEAEGETSEGKKPGADSERGAALRHLIKSHAGIFSDHNTRRAALNVMEDAEAARTLADRENTERIRAEAALAASEERLRLLVDSALEHAILSLDLNRVLSSWNPGAERIFGYTAQEAIGQTADLIFTPEDRAADVPDKEMRTALEKGRAADNRWQQRKDGSRFWANGAMLPIRSRAGGDVIGFVKILRDETELERSRQALVESREELVEALRRTQLAQAEAEAANRAKDHFLALLSHELRTPLTPVLMATAMLLEDENLTPMARDALRMIERNILLEARLVDDLLDVTRIGRGKMELSMAPTDVHTAIEYAVEVCLPDVAAKKHRLKVSLKAKRHQRNGDQARLQQAFWNLLKNACKFTPEGGEITLQTWNQGSNIIISLKDSGIGLEPGAAVRIFDPFVQANEGITRVFGGLGLGLAISKATVEAHGGTISAESKGRDQGTTFEISLPLSA